MAEKIYACIDLGSTTIKMLLVKEVNNKFVPVSTHKFESRGIKKGFITDIHEVTESLVDAIEKVERMTNHKLNEVFVGMGDLTVQSIECTGVISIANPDQIVTKEEIDRVLESAKLADAPSDLEVVHVTPVEFSIDQMRHIKSPYEMKGTRLAMKGMLGLANRTAIHSMSKVIENAGLSMRGLLLNPFALTEHLSKEDRTNGAWVIDIGGQTTTITVVEKDKIQNIKVLGLGSDLVTQDLCFAFQMTSDKAKLLKHEVGLLREEGFVRVQTKVGTVQIDRAEVYDVISARMEEIMEAILEAIQSSEVIIPSDRVIFTGGGAAIEGFLELAAEYFGARTSLLTPNNQTSNNSSDFTAISGLIPLYFKNYGELDDDWEETEPHKIKEKTVEKSVKVNKPREPKEKTTVNKLLSMFFE